MAQETTTFTHICQNVHYLAYISMCYCIIKLIHLRMSGVPLETLCDMSIMNPIIIFAALKFLSRIVIKRLSPEQLKLYRKLEKSSKLNLALLLFMVEISNFCLFQGWRTQKLSCLQQSIIFHSSLIFVPLSQRHEYFRIQPWTMMLHQSPGLTQYYCFWLK